MKKIAFFVQWMLCGGVENALIALTTELQKQGHDVTIYVITRKGEFIDKVPSCVKLKEIPMDKKIRDAIPVGGTKVSARECINNKEYFRTLKFLIKHKLNKGTFAELNIPLNNIQELKEQYDIAINYHIHSPFLVWYLSEKVVAKKKFTWIHNDFKTTHYDIKTLEKYLVCIEQFFAVSDQVRKEFLSIYPEFISKTSTALNLIPIEEVSQKADEYYPKEYTTSSLKLLTVGRLEEQKGYNIAIDVCEKLKKINLKFDWYVLGDGTQRKFLEGEIKKKKLGDCFHLLGTRMNPYPYFKNCDIYVQTSLHEGNSIVLVEAKLFNKPIVTTNVAGAREQIVDKETGRIVEIDAETVFEALKEMISNDSIRKKYSDNLKNSSFVQNSDYIQKYF